MCAAGTAGAWVYPEHRDIAVLAVESLDPERRAAFDRLWADARAGYEGRLCEHGADLPGAPPDCINWASMSAIAGDHSCSSAQMLDTVLNSDWILKVAGVAAQLRVDLLHVSQRASAANSEQKSSRISELRREVESESIRAQRSNALRIADVRLQRADPGYATRAGSNNAHFLLARPTTEFTEEEYFQATLSQGSEINAIGVFGSHHLTAMQKATRLAQEQFTPEERSALTRAMLADEAFALHFLEDVYAAGHVAGTWGDVAQRKGSHDYYNGRGLEVSTWEGGATTIVLMGDANMRSEDAQRAAATVRLSLEQLLDTAAGRPRKTNLPYTPQAAVEPSPWDVCTTDRLPVRPEGTQATPQAVAMGVEVLAATPVPGLGEGLGSLPRFRAEVGPFIGMSGALDARHVDGGFTGEEDGSGFIGGADLALRAGYGLDGVLGDAGDGLVFFALGYRGDTASSNKFSDTQLAGQAGNLAAAIPSRNGFSARLRMPFYLIPGDLLLLAPMYLFKPQAYQHMAVTAVNGGLVPWQLGWATSFGRFQFVLGREFGVTLYGTQSDQSLLAPGVPGTPRIVRFKSTYLDLPILEYRPYHAFDTTQTAEVVIQLFGGVDDPYGAQVISPIGAPGVPMDRVYYLGVRLLFDWRHYF
jgi:hypothetical protein